MEAGSGLPAAVVVRDILRITSPLQRARLFAELRRRPTLFRDEQQPGTAAAQRFTLALIARGHGLRPPRCSRCGREGLAKHHDGAGGKLCNPCVSLVRAPVCVMCGRRDHRYRTRDGAHYCASCWWTTPAGVSERAALNALEARALQTRRVVFITRTVAARCDAPLTSIVRAVLTPVTSGRVLAVMVRELEAYPDILTVNPGLAGRSLQQVIRFLVGQGFQGLILPRCPRCGRNDVVLPLRSAGVHLCGACHRREHSTACEQCGRVLALRPQSDGRRLCAACDQRNPANHRVCSGCGRFGRVAVNKDTGPLCGQCYVPPSHTCDRCGGSAPIASRIGGRSHCLRCYNQLRSRPAVCPGCGDLRLVAYWHVDRYVCAGCAEMPAHLACRRCRSESVRMNGVLCSDCAQSEYVDKLLSGVDGRVIPALEPLRTVLLDDTRASVSTITWALRGRGAKVIAAMARGDLPISAASLAAVTPEGVVTHLGSLFHAAGIIDASDLLIARYQLRVAAIMPEIPGSCRILTEQYVRWEILPRLRSFDTTRDSAPVLRRETRRLKTIRDLYSFIDASGHEFATVPQRVLDQFATRCSPADRGQLSPFLRWARGQGATRVRIQPHRTNGVAPATGDTDRWRHVRTLLADENLPLKVRVGGLLILLLGQQATRVVRLRLDDVRVHEDVVEITLGEDPVALPRVAGELISRLRAERMDSRNASEWLFVGASRGQHLYGSSLRSALRNAGVPVGAGRVSALLHLARTVPAPILADLLGLSATAAANWSEAAARSWSDYPRIRTTSQ